MVEAPADNWNAGPGSKRSGSSPAALIGVGVVMLVVGCFGGCIGGWLLGAASGAGDSLVEMMEAVNMPVDGEVVVDAPEEVTVGEPFTVTVNVANLAPRDRVMHSLDIRGALADQFEFTSLEPIPASTASEYGWREYTYSVSLAASGTRSITLTMQAKSPGEHSGEIDVYLDAVYHQLSRPVTIRVVE